MLISNAPFSSAIVLLFTFIITLIVFLCLYKKFKSFITNDYVWLSILVVIFIIEFFIAKSLLLLF